MGLLDCQEQPDQVPRVDRERQETGRVLDKLGLDGVRDTRKTDWNTRTHHHRVSYPNVRQQK